MQRDSGNSYLPTRNHAGGASLGRSNLIPINMTPYHGSHTPYMLGSEQRASRSINLSLPAVANLNLENGADGSSAALASSHSRSGSNYSNWSPTIISANVSIAYHPERNYFSCWIPAAMLPIMHAPNFFVPLPHMPWNWTYSSFSVQVPSVYHMTGTIRSEVISRQDSLPLVPASQFQQISLAPGAERVITGENMVNSSFAVQQVIFRVNHSPRFMGDDFLHHHLLRQVNHGPGPTPLHPYNFHMAQHGGGQIGTRQTFYVGIENMSYEVLLAFQDQVGYVSTGLSKEVILARMKCIKYQSIAISVNDSDRCCICLDNFCDGQTIGFADCGHYFHFDCITEWLMQKNSCPLCKRTALTT
ncbi:uncharacterized protein LOC107827571 isoform X1 [Nicotiana tabacum]|uniref:RING-type E3 ubiquitin transferase n=1 Tax=Nicotiana tabacum TaxID=4097 RepID=A0A1S4D9X3_TOBAC|nr:PREDICTED: E3 ubiquitin-protein ligase MBR1-like isoform X1 [Nicotiana tabacum]